MTLRHMTDAGRRAVLDRFRWVQGHADIWSVFADGTALVEVVDALANPWRGYGVTRVVGIESRGFLLGGATALVLRVGFVATRKGGAGLLPGPKVRSMTDQDYRGNRYELRMQAVLGAEDRVLLVDDWAEKGSQAVAAERLVNDCGAQFLGLSVIVDQLPDDVRSTLGRVTSLVTGRELGPDTESAEPKHSGAR